MPSAKKNLLQLGILILLIGLFIFIILKYFHSYLPPGLSKFFAPTASSSPLPSPRPIPHGIKKFAVSQSDKTVPQFREGSIDPYDPEINTSQTVTIRVKHKNPVSKVTAMLITDNAQLGPVSLSLISGTNINGEWQGSIPITDTYLYTYILVLKAEDEKGTIGTVKSPLR